MSNFSLGYPIGAPVNNLNIVNYEDLRPCNNNFMLRSGANIFVSPILVQGRCVWDLPIIIKFIHYFKKIHSFLNIVQYCIY